MAIEKIYILPGGLLHIDRSIFLSTVDMGMVIKAPVFSILLYDPEGSIIVDMGLNPSGVDHPDEAWGPRAKLIRPTVTPEDDVRARLKELSLTKNDIKAVIITHLHWDHTGALRFFDHCPILVQRDELRFAFNPDPFLSSPYMANHFDHQLNFLPIDGDRLVAPGISVIKTPGHTPGHQSVLVKTIAGQYFIFAGDAISLQENLTRKISLGNTCNARDCLDSIHRLDHLSQLLGAEIIPSHDLEVFQAINTWPQALAE